MCVTFFKGVMPKKVAVIIENKVYQTFYRGFFTVIDTLRTYSDADLREILRGAIGRDFVDFPRI